MSFKFDPPECPQCGAEASGVLETIPNCTAELDRAEDGSYDYAGHTEVNWDGQFAIVDDEGRVTLTCGYHEWQAKSVGGNHPAYATGKPPA